MHKWRCYLNAPILQYIFGLLKQGSHDVCVVWSECTNYLFPPLRMKANSFG